MNNEIVPPELYTIGYQGIAQAALFHTLLFNDIQVLLDIRERPLSRKPGFSKTALGVAARSHGIEYEHIRALGTPSEIRSQRKIDHDYEAFREGYLEHLAMQEEAMEALVTRIQRERCCLMCYEADAQECHRLFVSERVKEMTEGALIVIHLTVGEETP